MFLEKIMTLPYALSAFLTVVADTGSTDGMTDAEIRALFNSDGAAGEGGSLNSVKTAVQDFGSGTVSIVQTAFIFIAVVAVIFGAVGMVVHSNKSQELSEDKKGMLWKIACVIIVVEIILQIFR